MTTPTESEIKNAFIFIKTIADSIREAKRIPSGTLYAVLMDKISLSEYEKVIAILKKSELIEEKNHELIWILK
jgi:hypothetical protein